MSSSIGPLELVIVLVIVLVDLRAEAPARPRQSLGTGMREFKDSITGKHKDDDDERPALDRARRAPTPERTSAAAASLDARGFEPSAP